MPTRSQILLKLSKTKTPQKVTKLNSSQKTNSKCMLKEKYQTKIKKHIKSLRRSTFNK